MESPGPPPGRPRTTRVASNTPFAAPLGVGPMNNAPHCRRPQPCVSRQSRSTRSSPAPSDSGTRQQELELGGVAPQLPRGARLDLPHPLLRDPQLRTELTKRLLARAPDPEAADDDPPLALIEVTEQSRHDPLPPLLGTLLRAGVGARVGGLRHARGGPEGEPAAGLILPPHRPREVVPDRPGGVGAELVAAGDVETVDGPEQRQIAVAGPLGRLAATPRVPPRDRDDQPEVGPDDSLLDRRRRGAQPPEILKAGVRRRGGVDAGARPLGQAPQVVHLAEQVRLLVPG